MAPLANKITFDPKLLVSKGLDASNFKSQEDPRVLAKAQAEAKKKQSQKAVSTAITKWITSGKWINAPVVPNVIKTPVQQTNRSTELPVQTKTTAPLQPWQEPMPEWMPLIASNVSPQSLGELSNREYEFAQKAKAEWYSKQEIADFIAKKRSGETTQQPQEDKSILDQVKQWAKTVWAIWLWVAWTLAWWYAGGGLLKSIGKKVYWLTLPPWVDEARKIQSYEAWTTSYKPRTSVQTALDTPTMMWTRRMIGTQAEKQAKNIFTKTINPLLKSAQTKVNVLDTIKWMSEKIKSMAWLDPDKVAEYKNAFNELQKSFWWKDYKNMSLEELQTLKSSLQQRTPQKFFKWKEITNAYQELRWQLSTVIKNKLHEAIKSEFWVDSAKQYLDYANLQWLKEVWIKARTQSGLKWWAGNFISTVVEELWTPISTIIGKAAYKTWQWLQAVPKLTVWLLKKWGKFLLKWASLAKALGDGSLVPWSPSYIANKVMMDNAEYNDSPDNFYDAGNIIYKKSEVDKAIQEQWLWTNKFKDENGTIMQVIDWKLYQVWWTDNPLVPRII